MEKFQIKKILVPVDFSKTSLRALDVAAKISKTLKAEIILLHVSAGLYENLEPDYFSMTPLIPLADYQNSFIDQSNQHLNNLANKLKLQGIEKVSVMTSTGKIENEIIEQSKKTKADLIVMGTHGVSGITEFFVGSNTFRVIRNAKCPVLSIPKKTKVQIFKNILVPFRDKPHSREKVNYAIDLALMFSSTLHIIGIDTEFTKSHLKKIKLEADQIKAIAKEHGVECKTKIISNAYAGDVVLKHARDINADLIISMSDLDKMNLTEYFTGPFAQQIVNHSPIPVFSIRPKFNTDTIDLRFY